MAYKFQIGDALLGGALRQKGTITGEGTVSASSDLVIGAAAINETELEYLDSAAPGAAAARKVLVADGSRNIGNLVGISGSAGVFSTSVSGAAVQVPKDGLAIAGTNVTTTAGELNLLDGASAGAVANSKAVIYSAAGIVQGTDFKGPDGFDIGNASVADFIKLNAAEVIFKDGALDVDVASHDGTNGLKLGGTLLTATAAELNVNDGVTAGTVLASKVVVVDSNKDISEFRNLQAVQLSASSNIVIGAADLNETDLEQIDGITAGTAAASKALVLDSSADLTSGIRNFTIGGNLTVQGTTTTIESETLVVKDPLIELNIVTGSEGRSTNANAGLYISGSTQNNDASLQLAADGGRFRASGSSPGFDIIAGGDYAIAGASVLNATTLGGAVVNSSLTQVGALAAGSIASGFTKINVANVLDVNSIDIDGATAIGAALADADLFIIDDGASGTNRKATMAELSTYIGSAGARATGYTMRSITQAQGTTFQMAGLTGFYGFESDHTASMNVDLSGSWDAGDLVVIKSNASGAAYPVTIRGNGSDVIDGQSSVTLESAFAAIQLVYDGSSWNIM